MNRTITKFRVLLMVVLLVGIVKTVVILRIAGLDIREYAAERRGVLVTATQREIGIDSVFSHGLLTLVSNTGLKVECAILTPVSASGPVPAFILLGGKATGKDAVRYVVGIKNVVVVALDYPYTPRESYSVGNVISDLPDVRTSLLDVIPSVNLVTDHLSADPMVDTTRIVLSGYSFGAPFVPAAMVSDTRIDVGVMAYGGGDLPDLVYRNVRRYREEAFSRLVWGVSLVVLRPIEPTTWVGDVSPRRLLFVNGTDDDRIPRRNARLVYDQAREPKKMVWIESGHVHPSNEELTARIIREMKAALLEWGVVERG